MEVAKELEYALVIDDTVDMGKEPLPIINERIQNLKKKHLKELEEDLKAH